MIAFKDRLFIEPLGTASYLQHIYGVIVKVSCYTVKYIFQCAGGIRVGKETVDPGVKSNLNFLNR